MKSEHRHDLQTNELGKMTEKLGPFMEVHGNRLMIGVCVVSLVASGVIYWVRTQRNSEAAAWREMSTAVNTNKPEDFRDVWEGHKGTPTGLWARVHEGESWLTQGVETLFRSHEAGIEDVKKARDAFQTVVDDRRAPAEVRERGLIGLGRALESMSDGSEADAIKSYEALVSEFPNSFYKKDAEERIAALNKGSGQEFYAWFSKYPRPKVDEKRPNDRSGGELDEEMLDDLVQKHSGSKSSAKKGTTGDESESPTIPDLEKSEEPKPDSVPVPDSTPDADEKPSSE